MTILTNGLETLVLNVEGLRFDAIARGPEDGPLVLFLHGFPAFASCWTDLMGAVAAAGYRCVAVDQRGYSPGARPEAIEDYAMTSIVGDAAAFADRLAKDAKIHLVGHDFGGLVGWAFASTHPQRLHSLTVLSTPHTSAFLEAKANDPEQKKKSAYIDFFRLPGHVAEQHLLRDDAKALRGIYEGKVPAAIVEENVRRLSESGALTAALNWYRALGTGPQPGRIEVPTLYVWSTADLALGETAARATANHVKGPYHFEILEGRSHWLPEEAAAEVGPLLLGHLGRYP